MKQTIVMFCYREEEGLLPITVKRIRTVLPLASVHLFDDDADPLPKSTAEALTEMAGVFYERTTFDRQKNLNGAECIRGELACMQRAAEKDGNTSGIIIKMDPDVIVLRTDALMELIAQGCKFIASPSAKGIFSGMFYAMTRDVLDTVKHHATLISFPENAVADECIGTLAYIATNATPYTGLTTRLIGATNYGTEKYREELAWVASQGHIVAVGTGGLNKMASAARILLAKDLLNEYNRQQRKVASNSTPETAVVPAQDKPSDVKYTKSPVTKKLQPLKMKIPTIPATSPDADVVRVPMDAVRITEGVEAE